MSMEILWLWIAKRGVRNLHRPLFCYWHGVHTKLAKCRVSCSEFDVLWAGTEITIANTNIYSDAYIATVVSYVYKILNFTKVCTRSVFYVKDIEEGCLAVAVIFRLRYSSTLVICYYGILNHKHLNTHVHVSLLVVTEALFVCEYL